MYEWAFGVSIAAFLYSLTLLRTYDPSGDIFQLLTPDRLRSWIIVKDVVRIQYLLGIDGISLFPILLTTFITPLAILTTLKSPQDNYRHFLLSILALETCLLGTLCAIDMFLFMVFWMVSLVPLFFITGAWGHGLRAGYTIKFMIVSLAGCASLMVTVFSLYAINSTGSFSLLDAVNDPDILAMNTGSQSWLFWGFMLAFISRLPVFPFHTWLPDLNCTTRPTGNIYVNALFVPLGAFGIARFCLTLTPEACADYASIFMALGVTGLIYGAWIGAVQRDMGRLTAYLTVSHTGYILIGLFSMNETGLTGALMHTVTYGLCIAGYIIITGFILERFNSLKLENFGGLAKVTPVMGLMLLIISLALTGLPGLAVFASTFAVIAALFEDGNYVMASFTVTGIIWLAITLLGVFHRVFFGKTHLAGGLKIRDLDRREFYILVIIVLLAIFIGIFSPLVTTKMRSSTYRSLYRINYFGNPPVSSMQTVTDTGIDLTVDGE
jgi:NADH-quinone oxidoreductase subunit M